MNSWDAVKFDSGSGYAVTFENNRWKVSGNRTGFVYAVYDHQGDADFYFKFLNGGGKPVYTKGKE